MKVFILLLISLSLTQFTFSQYNTGWYIAPGFNAVDDDGDAFHDVFKIKSNWIFLSMPSSFTVGYKLNKAISVEFAKHLNSYNTGDLKDHDTVVTPIIFLAMDVFGKYHLNSLYSKVQWFDPFVCVGMGATLRGKDLAAMPSFGFGLSFWFTERLGINLQSCAKFNVLSKNSSSYLIHSVDFRIKVNN